MTETLHNHVEHYMKDADEFDYFYTENPSLREEERRRMQLLRRQVKVKAGQAILDAGSGGGWVSKAFLSRNVSVCAVDLSLKNLLEIRNRFDQERMGSYVVADLYRLPFKSFIFDIATSNDVYEHLEHLDPAAKELRRVLKDGGCAVVSVPYEEKIVYYLCIHCNKPTPVNAHLHSFNETNLGNVFLRNGFTIGKITRFLNRAMLALQVYYLLCRWMPYWLWRSLDVLANMMVRRPGRISMKIVAEGKAA